MRYWTLPLFLLAVGLFAPETAQAFDPWSTPMGARGMALGGAVIASGTGSDAMTTNPASMSLIRSYIWENYYQYNTSESGHLGQMALVDSFKNQRLAAGLYYAFSVAEPEAYYNGSIFSRNETYMKGGLALSLLFSRYFALGVNSYYYDYSPEDAQERSSFSMDVGAVSRITDYLVVGAVAYDLLSDHDDLHPWSFGAGVALTLFKTLTLEFDTVLEGKKPWYKLGAELLFSKNFILRGGGGRRERQDLQYFSVGLGYITKKTSVELSVMQYVEGSKSTLVGVDFRFFLR